MRHASLSVDAGLALRFTMDGVRLRRQDPPLRVVRAFGPLVHLHNLSGGVLSGDKLRLEIDVDAGACAQITTTSATRVYRCDEPAQQTTAVRVGRGGLLEFVPDALIPFAGAQYAQSTNIELHPGAGLFWWEMLAPGRAARGETFAYRAVSLDLSIRSSNVLIARERVHLEPEARPLESPARMGRYLYSASFYICKAGEPVERWSALEAELNALAREISQPERVLWGASALFADGVVVRGAALEGRFLMTGLHRMWTQAKWRLYGAAAVAPRKVL